MGGKSQSFLWRKSALVVIVSTSGLYLDSSRLQQAPVWWTDDSLIVYGTKSQLLAGLSGEPACNINFYLPRPKMTHRQKKVWMTHINLHSHYIQHHFYPSIYASTSRCIMEFPVKWNLEQLGRGEHLTEEIKAAETLERCGYRVCIVGDLASVVYGSDVVVSDIYIAVADGSLRSALETLLEHGFLEEPQTTLRFRSVVSAKDCSSGWPGYRLHGSRPDDVGILLIPSSLWHLDLNGMSFLSDTLLFPGSMCRFPRMESYLNGEIKFRLLYLSSCITKLSISSFNSYHSWARARRLLKF